MIISSVINKLHIKIIIFEIIWINTGILVNKYLLNKNPKSTANTIVSI